MNTQTRFYQTLQFKLTMVFGTFTALSVLLASYFAYDHAVGEFSRELRGELLSVGTQLSQMLDADKLQALSDRKDPYYKDLKTQFRHFTKNFNLSWIGVYRFNGRFFTHIVDGAEFGSEFCLDYPIFDVIPEMLSAYKEGKTFVTDNYVDTYGTWMSAFIPVVASDGRTVAIIDSSKNVDMVNRLKEESFSNTLKIIFVLTILSIVFCVVFAYSLSSPLGRLTKGAELIAAGDLQYRIPGPHNNDEIGLLVQTFNGMAQRISVSQRTLERKIFELTILYEIGKTINFANNTQEILKLILEKSIQVLNAERGSVMLFSEETGLLNVEVVFGQGLSHPEQRIEIRPGEGVAGRVFEESQHLIINDNLESVFKPYEVGVESEVRNIMCLPLLLEKKPIGVMNIVNKTTGGFDSQDLELASTMSSQAAIVIEKSRLYELSITDGLTKLFVHRYFQVTLENEIRRAKRYSKPVSLILFDIDHFKKFNDTYGHQMGDKVLVYTSQILRDAIRSIDVAARYGGEEFVLILPETEAGAAFEVAERLRKRVEAFDYPGQDTPVKVTISLGVSSFPLHTEDRLDLIKKADDALYGSKKAGRNCVTMYTPPTPTPAA
jgi:diguanylate cyclase (GGDEF)-like protein